MSVRTIIGRALAAARRLGGAPAFEAPFAEALALHKVFMAGGATADEIFVSTRERPAEPGTSEMAVTVVRGGQLRYGVVAGPHKLDEAAWRAAWTAAARRAAEMSDEDLRRALARTKARDEAALHIAALVAQGFVPGDVR